MPEFTLFAQNNFSCRQYGNFTIYKYERKAIVKASQARFWCRHIKMITISVSYRHLAKNKMASHQTAWNNYL